MSELSLKELKDLADDNEIDLSARGLTTVPKALPQVPRLTHVDLGSNKIVELPPSICSMTRLVRLELGSNLLGHLPDNIGALVHLEHFDLYNNQIEELPLSFANLCSLRWLDLKKNPLEPELMKAAGNCGNEKECRQAAVNVVSYMKALSKAHQNEMLQQQKVIEKIHEVKGDTKEHNTQKNKKKHNKKDAHVPAKHNNDLLHTNNKTTSSQQKESKKGKEVARPSKPNRGFFSRMIWSLIKLCSAFVVLGLMAVTAGIVFNCTSFAKAKPENKAICADLTKLSEFKSPSPQFFANIRKAYGDTIQSSVSTSQKKWEEFHREFIKSDVGIAVDSFYHKMHAFVVDAVLRAARFFEAQRLAFAQWWETDGKDRFAGAVETVEVTFAVLYEIAKDLFHLASEMLQRIYHRSEVFVNVWSNHGLAKAIDSSV
ncbi:hypothetical protein KIN20_001660 [Parelaphostrongylus tenuis]|uniref:Uncharacterized protein n=1 Tax=Parelaphostrongylus tenuis TaxID=148309 RepID=A0AAD5LXA6_PARTN|nr:hypothetical protein KIN20_001660 [Parelaphostrongylus tenuis]